MMSVKEWRDVTPAQRIERVENLLRVLRALTPHERKKHFDMGTWGAKTQCGTVACAAGWAGMDPWFKRRGFVMLPDTWDCFPKMSPYQFFGYDLFYDVFVNSRAIRTHAQAVRKISLYLKTLKEVKANG